MKCTKKLPIRGSTDCVPFTSCRRTISCSPVLQYADAARTPVIVDQARQGHLPPMKEDLRQRVIELLDDDTKVTEQFALLITAWCHDNPIINQCFGSMAD